MKIAEFDYELPAELIAQTPLEQRDASRMLVLDRAEQTWVDAGFKEFTRFLRPFNPAFEATRRASRAGATRW